MLLSSSSSSSSRNSNDDIGASGGGCSALRPGYLKKKIKVDSLKRAVNPEFGGCSTLRPGYLKKKIKVNSLKSAAKLTAASDDNDDDANSAKKKYNSACSYFNSLGCRLEEALKRADISYTPHRVPENQLELYPGGEPFGGQDLSELIAIDRFEHIVCQIRSILCDLRCEKKRDAE